jgi:GNAT superfamily N-acetyltransferase
VPAPHLPGGFVLRFVVGNGEQLKKRLQGFPNAWIGDFLGSKILVLAVADNKTLAAYGIRGLLNLTSLFVEESYRNRGMGKEIRKIAFDEARRQGIHFLTGEVSSQLLSSKYGLILFSKFNCRVVKRLKKRRSALVVFPLTNEGYLAYVFLRIAFSFVPNTFLEPISAWIGKRTLAQQ